MVSYKSVATMSPTLQKEINHYLSKKTIYFKNFSQELINHLETIYPNQTLQAQWFVLKNNITTIPICKFKGCNNDVKFNQKNKEFDLGCCKTHNQKITFKKNYGIDHPLKNKKQQEKLRKSVKAKYGVDSIAQLDSTKDKIKNTTKVKYGVNSIAELQSTKDKREATMIENYGVSHAQQSTEIRAKTHKTNLDKFGVTEPLSSPTIREKGYHTNMERYGSIFPMRNKELLAKRLESIIEKYDAYSPIMIKENISKNYQLEKSIEAENNNSIYYYFFDEEIENKQKQIKWIVDKQITQTISEIEFKDITHEERDIFIIANSLYMKDTEYRFNYGVFNGDTLVAVFSGFEKEDYYEISRFVIKIGVSFEFNIITEFVTHFNKIKPIIIPLDRRFTPLNQPDLIDAGFEFVGGTDPKLHAPNIWDCGKLVYKFY